MVIHLPIQLLTSLQEVSPICEHKGLPTSDNRTPCVDFSNTLVTKGTESPPAEPVKPEMNARRASHSAKYSLESTNKGRTRLAHLDIAIEG